MHLSVVKIFESCFLGLKHRSGYRIGLLSIEGGMFICMICRGSSIENLDYYTQFILKL